MRHGQWPDMDMLVVGLNGKGGPSSDLGGKGCTQHEYQTQMSLWCMMSSPLALSNDMRKLTADDLRIISNAEAIAINQDALGKAAERKVCQDDQQIFVRELSGGRHAVALINTADQDRRITVDFRSLGLTGKYRLRDIWAHKQIASKATKWTGTVASHETKVWLLE